MKKLFTLWAFISGLLILSACDQSLTSSDSLDDVYPVIESFLSAPITHETNLPFFEGTPISYVIEGEKIETLKDLKRPAFDRYIQIEITIYASDQTLTISEDIMILSDYSPNHNYEIHLTDVDFEGITKDVFTSTQISVHQEEDVLISQEGFIRGRGNSNWFNFEKKSYRISFDQDIDMMGLRPHHDYLLIGMHGDKSLMRDALAHQLSKMLDLEITQDTRYVDLYVNEAYHGLYLLIEDRTYIKTSEETLTFALELDHRIDWDQTGEPHIRIEGAPYGIKRSTDLEEETLLEITEYLNDVMSDLKNGILHEDIDDENWVSYMMVQELFKNVDAWGLSVFIYRDQEGSLKFGPVWDFDFALGNADYVNEQYYEPEGFFLAFDSRMAWFYHAMRIDAFKAEFKAQMTSFHEEELPTFLNVIEVLGERLKPYSDKNFQRWDIFNEYLWPTPMFMVEFNDHLDHVDYIYQFIEERSSWFQEVFKLDLFN